MSYYFDWADEATKRAVWNRGTPIDGYDPTVWRRDMCGRAMKYSAHGDRTHKHGWEIDHVYPVAMGGSDALTNLQPLHWTNNAAKGDDTNWYCGK